MKLFKLLKLVFLLILILTISGCNRDQKLQTPRPQKVAINTHQILRYKSIVIKSKLLSKDMKVNIYLPLGYSRHKKYPVLYILPAGNGSQNFCIPGLKMEKSADKLIKSKKINPLIIVSPETDNSLGLNSSDKYIRLNINGNIVELGRYEDYISKELVRYIDSHYNTIASREGRYIGGMSDGGYIALRIAFRHPKEYSKVGGHSPYIPHKVPSSEIKNLYFPTKEAAVSGDIYYLAQKNPISGLNIYLDAGNSDRFKLYNYCSKLNVILQSKKVKSQFHLNEGNHSSEYWKSNMDKYLIFYNEK